MANIAIFRINYKSDFILTLQSDAGWMTPFCIKFWTCAPSQAYFAGYDGTTYTHCAPVAGDPTKLMVQFDDHHLPIGDLKFQIGYHFTVADFPTSIEDEVINQAAVIIDNDGEQQQVMLDFNGETAPEIEFSLPAYANEAQRIANESQRIANEEQRIATETQRIANEEQRISQEQTRQQNEVQRIVQEQARVTAERERFNDYAKLKVDAIAATDAANSAADLANEKAQLAADNAQLAADKAALAQSASALATEKAQLATDKAALAQSAATLANEKAALAQQKAEYATAQGDYAKAQGDYAKAQAGVIPTDVTRTQTDATFVNGNHDPLFCLRQANSSLAGLMTAAGYTKLNDMPGAQEVNAGLAYDVSVLHPTSGVSGGSTYASLSAALAVIPQDKRKGGMTVKFVQSSDNKYVQYRYMGTEVTGTPNPFLNVNNWTGGESVPQSIAEIGFNPSTSLSPAATSGNWKLTGNGLCVSDESFEMLKYLVNEGDVLKLNLSKDSNGVMQFQNAASVPSSGTNTNLVGAPYTNAINEMIKVPTGATYLIVSQSKTNITNYVEKTIGVDEKILFGSKNLAESGSVFDFASPILPQVKYNKTDVSGWTLCGTYTLLKGYKYKMRAKLSEPANADKYFNIYDSESRTTAIATSTILQGETETSVSFTISEDKTGWLFSFGAMSAAEIIIENNTIKEIGEKTKSLEDGLAGAVEDLKRTDLDVYGGEGLIEDIYIDNLNFNTQGEYVANSNYCTSYIEIKKAQTCKVKVTNSENASIEVRIGVSSTIPSDEGTGDFLKSVSIPVGNFGEYTYTANADGYLSVSGWKSDSVKNPQFYIIGKSILHSLITVEELTSKMNADIYSVPSNRDRIEVAQLNFKTNGVKYETSVSYKTYYIPVIANNVYRIVLDNTSGNSNIDGRCSFSTSIPANNVGGKYLYGLSASAGETNQFDYLPEENGYIAFSIWYSNGNGVSFKYCGYGIIERITQLSNNVKENGNGILPQLYCGEKSLVSQSSGTVVKMSQKTAVPYDNVKVDIVCPEDIVIWFDWILTPYTQTITTSQYYGNGDKAIFPAGNNIYTIYFAKGSKSGSTYILSGKSLSTSDISYMIEEGNIRMSYNDCDVIVNNKGCENTARAIAYRDLPCFSHISDVHGDAIRYDNFMQISKYYGMNAAINTGDNVCVGVSDGMTFLDESIEKYPDVIQLSCIGNHDNRGSNANNYQYFYKMFADAFDYELSTDKTYYYKDFASAQIRVISLNIYEERCIGYACRISEAQIEWFISTLQSTPQGYGIIVIAHSTEKWIEEVANKDNFYDYATTRDWCTRYANITGDPVSTIVDAFISKTSIQGSYSQLVYAQGSTEEQVTEEVSYSADFTNLNSGVEFIAYVNGHKHHDNIGYLENTTNIQLSLNITQGAATEYYDYNDLPRGYGKGSVQDAINLYYIDRQNGTVKVVRIGSNLTYDLVERDKLIIPYK